MDQLSFTYIYDQHCLWREDSSKGKRGILQYRTLSGELLTNKDLSGMTLSNVIFTEDIEGCSFKDAILINVNFCGLILEEVDFTSSRIKHCVFTSSSLKDCTSNKALFTGGILKDCLWKRCTCNRAVFEGCYMVGADFVDCEIKEARFEGCNLVATSYNQCQLSSAVFKRCEAMSMFLTHCSADSTVFEKTDLSGGIIKHTSINHAEFTEVTMKNTRFTRTSVSSANLPFPTISEEERELNLYKVAKHALATDGGLCMESWHSECNTSHCVAGWIVHLNKDARKVAEEASYTLAGLLFLGEKAAEMFYEDTEVAQRFLESVLHSGKDKFEKVSGT